MSHAPVVRPSVVKSTYKHFSEVLSAYWTGDRLGGSNSLIDLLHVSPRLIQWAKVAEGYRIWSSDEALSVTVTPEKIYTTKGVRVDDLQSGLPAQTLYKTIETAQEIVQSHRSSEKDEDFFVEEDDYAEGAGLDAALVDSHSAEPVSEDDVELIGDVVEEAETGTPEESLTVDPEPYSPERLYSQEVEPLPAAESFTAHANRKNAVTDGAQCPYCGNLNRDAYKGTCPQCPKTPGLALYEIDKAVGKATRELSASTVARFKSLQGRVLTIIDGSFGDKTQREAVKTLINKEFRREISLTKLDVPEE